MDKEHPRIQRMKSKGKVLIKGPLFHKEVSKADVDAGRFVTVAGVFGRSSSEVPS
jgi:hypothetical protein